MTIVSSELKWRKPSTVTNTDANGGRMTRHEIVSGVKNALFPDVSLAERQAGVERLRKAFAHVANDDDLALLSPCVHLTSVTAGDDWVTLMAGTQRDTAGDLTGEEREYGAGVLASDVLAGATSFDLTVEDSSLAACFQDGDTVWISDGENEEYHTDVTVSSSGSTVTVTLASGDMLANDYDALDGTDPATCGASVLEPDSVAAEVADWTETSTAGTFDESGYPVECDNIGTVEQDWTLVFASATEFSVSGDEVGAVGTGSLSADFAPANSNASGKPFFTLRSAGWGGTWASGDSVTFTTSPAAVPVWFREVVPAGAATTGANYFGYRISGESA